jgi:hypothetical protein
MTSAVRMGQRAVSTHVISAFSLWKRQPRTKKKWWRGKRNIRQCQDHGCISDITRFSEGLCDIYYAERSGRHPSSKDSAKPHIYDTTTTVLGYREVRSMCRVSKSSVFNILKEYFDKTGVCARWVPSIFNIRWS